MTDRAKAAQGMCAIWAKCPDCLAILPLQRTLQGRAPATDQPLEAPTA